MDELIYRIALSMLPLNCAAQRELLERFGTATRLYDNRHDLRAVIPEATPNLLSVVGTIDSRLERAASEVEYCTRMGIRILTIDDPDYPQRLLETHDAPTVLYYRGTADLNAPHCISMVGTRKCNEYGRDLCDGFIDELRQLVPDVVVFSGLAFGIDIASHRRCLKCDIPTVGVVAHGHDTLYPVAHRAEAEAMMRNGGILTEYHSFATINRNNFLARNRIVAGCSDATIVVQSPEHGGALHTARLSNEYGRDVYTFPARIDDAASHGCIDLVYNNAATLIRTARQFVERQGWTCDAQGAVAVQTSIFTSNDERIMNIVKTMRSFGEPMRLEQIASRAVLSNTEAMTFLIELEMEGVVETCANGRYRLEKAYR